MVSLQVVPFSESHPFQPEKLEPAFGEAVSETTSPFEYFPVQLPGHLICPSPLVTDPSPFTVTVRTNEASLGAL
jgi:hypothetical protein